MKLNQIEPASQIADQLQVLRCWQAVCSGREVHYTQVRNWKATTARWWGAQVDVMVNAVAGGHQLTTVSAHACKRFLKEPRWPRSRSAASCRELTTTNASGRAAWVLSLLPPAACGIVQALAAVC
jgi:hypothetical protein